MLPTTHHPHDAPWISAQVGRLPAHLRSMACEAYSKVYADAMGAEPAEHKRENAARFDANSRLRVYVARVTQYPNGAKGDGPQGGGHVR